MRDLMRRESLRPRTVTILADYASIAYRFVESIRIAAKKTTSRPPSCRSRSLPLERLPAEPFPAERPPCRAQPPAPHYTVRTEPFVPTDPDQLATLGVGPDSAGVAGRCLGVLRPRAGSPTVAGQSPAAADDGIELRRFRSGSLPLCETISRLTAAEFKNFGIHVDEFYGRLTDSPEILMAARSANLILYEGHVSYQDLIDEPVLRRSQAEDYPLEEERLEGTSRGSDGLPSSRRRIACRPRGS